jgi:hypothetical protein
VLKRGNPRADTSASQRTMSQHHDMPAIRRIVLPSGRTIEVLRFQDADGANRTTHPLHVCPRCDCNLVHPLTWAPAGEESWELELQCPNCWWTESAVYGRESIEALEDRLDQDLVAMLADVHRLAKSNMAEELERFIAALHHDAILPEDFGL